MKKPTSDQFYKFLQNGLSIGEDIGLKVLKAYLNTQIGQGFLKKIVNWVVDEVYAADVKPLLDVLLVRIGYGYDVHEGKVLIKRLKEARESGDVQDWNSTIDDINN